MDRSEEFKRVVGTTARTALKVGGGALAMRGLIITPDVVNDVGALAEFVAGVGCSVVGYVWGFFTAKRATKKGS